MTIGGALILVAAGAILKWAVTTHVSGFNIQTVGTILFIIGLVGLALAVLYTFWWPFSSGEDRVETRTTVRQPPPYDRPYDR